MILSTVHHCQHYIFLPRDNMIHLTYKFLQATSPNATILLIAPLILILIRVMADSIKYVVVQLVALTVHKIIYLFTHKPYNLQVNVKSVKFAMALTILLRHESIFTTLILAQQLTCHTKLLSLLLCNGSPTYVLHLILP